jgi:PAS domain-containing protein
MSNLRLSTLVDHLPVGILLLDSTGVIIYSGGAIESMLGYRQCDLAGKNAIRTLVVSPSDAMHWYRYVVSRQGLQLTKQLLLQPLDGPPLPFDCMVSNLLHIEAFGGVLITLSHTRDPISR